MNTHPKICFDCKWFDTGLCVRPIGINLVYGGTRTLHEFCSYERGMEAAKPNRSCCDADGIYFEPKEGQSK